MYVINARRRSGTVRQFSGDTQAEAWDRARAWLKAEDDVVAAAQRLLTAIGDARLMLEDTDESGDTQEAFADIQSALALATQEAQS